MSGPYFQKQSWSTFTYQATTYDLTHLDEFVVEVTDTTGNARRIAVGFSDHCFTRDAAPGDDPGLVFPLSTRKAGVFCVERYGHSLNLREHLAYAMAGKVWNVQGENFAIVPTVDHLGVKMLYGIIFSLDPVKKMPVHLDMRVRTAYPCNINDIVTYGNVRFTHLVALRMQGKRPNRNLDKHRPRPRLT